jgi:transcriptional regulator with XRE-family HTH domain
MSQLDLALQADVSPRHLSFVETGRSRPSAEMVLQLAAHRDRLNGDLLAFIDEASPAVAPTLSAASDR